MITRIQQEAPQKTKQKGKNQLKKRTKLGRKEVPKNRPQKAGPKKWKREGKKRTGGEPVGVDLTPAKNHQPYHEKQGHCFPKKLPTKCPRVGTL